MTLRLVPPADPPIPDPGGLPVCFLVDASGPLENRLIDGWIESNRPASEFRVVTLPPSRRRRRHRRGLEQLREAIESGGDALMVPLRVAWMPHGRSRRVPRLVDLITLGDPRDPNRLLQHLILRIKPSWVTVIAAETATLGDLRARWVAERVQHPDAAAGFTEFVALQGALALEVRERRLRGNRYKVPRFLSEDLLESASFQAGLDDLARRTGDDPVDLSARSARYLKEIAATPSTFVIDLVAALVRMVYTMGYEPRIRYDREVLERIAALGQRHPLAFLPSHKSNLDHLALTYVLYENGMPPNHTAGGINMNFFPIGPLLRRHGIFFIRRTFKDNEPYKFVLRRYIDYLLARRFPLEWYLEGGRSRTGKLRPPRYGMLSYVVDSWRRGSSDDVVLVPISIAYDQIQDVGAHAAEQRGRAKEKESFSWMLRALRSLRRRYGRIHISFGEPILLGEALGRHPAGGEPDPESVNLEIAKLAFEVSARINRVTPITPISLVTLALLGTDRALTVDETLHELRDFITYVEAKELPVTQRIDLDDPDEVAGALNALAEHGVVTRWDGGTETVYSVGADQHLAAAFYGNTIVHHFVTTAVAEVALAGVPSGKDALARFWAELAALRDLLKFEFFFSEKDRFRDEVASEVASHCPDWEEAIAGGGEKVRCRFRPAAAGRILRPIFEAYLLIADALVARDYRVEVDRKRLVAATLALGDQYRAQRRIRSPEAVSTELFESAIRLAENRGLLVSGSIEDLERRQAFADQIRGLVERIDRIEAG
ncbi:MAG: glycerol-3-phosphate 1-O-acyltransferase [Acidimicrobiia bacterium]|nr:MAG: glycerol-3-phosphate 1-O-acyltransferase [Acidimicrobiia bacterium]